MYVITTKSAGSSCAFTLTGFPIHPSMFCTPYCRFAFCLSLLFWILGCMLNKEGMTIIKINYSECTFSVSVNSWSAPIVAYFCFPGIWDYSCREWSVQSPRSSTDLCKEGKSTHAVDKRQAVIRGYTDGCRFKFLVSNLLKIWQLQWTLINTVNSCWYPTVLWSNNLNNFKPTTVLKQL